MDAGADLFLDKPVVLRELFSTLDKLWARCAARHEARFMVPTIPRTP
jgi:hypothetical protein